MRRIRRQLDGVGTADAETVDSTLAGSLESLDDALNYRDWIVDLAAPHLGQRLLEIGAGHGTFTERFAETGAVVAVEPGSDAAARLGERFVGDHLADEFGCEHPVEQFANRLGLVVARHDHAQWSFERSLRRRGVLIDRSTCRHRLGR